MHPDDDVPSPIDLRDPADAREWAASAQSRPGRDVIFRSFADAVSQLDADKPELLELGSGPGFLAEYLLQDRPCLRCALLDFSAAMHGLARSRLSAHADQVSYIERDFRHANWSEGLGRYHAAITNQAVHELRHKRHATSLHARVRSLLKEDGVYLVCDHYFGDGGLEQAQLYMTVEEQRDALSAAGFGRVVQLAKAGSLVLHRAS